MSRYFQQLARHAGLTLPTGAIPRQAAPPTGVPSADIREQIVERDASPVAGPFVSAGRGGPAVTTRPKETPTVHASERRDPAPTTPEIPGKPMVNVAFALNAPSPGPGNDGPAEIGPKLTAEQVLQQVMEWIAAGERDAHGPISPAHHNPEPMGSREGNMPRAQAGIVTLGTPRRPETTAAAVDGESTPSATVARGEGKSPESLRPHEPAPSMWTDAPVEPARNERDVDSHHEMMLRAAPAPASAEEMSGAMRPSAVARRHEPTASATPEIQVTIGTIELTVESPPPPPPAAPAVAVKPRAQAAPRPGPTNRATLPTQARRRYLRPFA